MNTKSRSFKVAPEFEHLFSFNSKEDKLEHRAQMISFRILSEVEKICEQQNIKMKDLAKMIDTSASYVTQLFRGNKLVNTAFMARIEEAMNMMFNVTLHEEREVQDENTKHRAVTNALKTLQDFNQGNVYFVPVRGGAKDKTDQLMQYLSKDVEEQKKAKQIG